MLTGRHVYSQKFLADLQTIMKSIVVLLLINFTLNLCCLAQKKVVTDFRNFTIAHKENSINKLYTDFHRNNIQVIFFQDSLANENWLKETTQEIKYFVPPPGIYDTLETCNEWVTHTNIKELSVLYIFNNSNFQKNICVFGRGCDAKQMAIIQQAKDETGDWKDLKDETMQLFIGKSENFVLKNQEALYIIFKFPTGDFHTDFRFKILVNSPPAYPKNIYLYSEIYKVKIDKSLLISGRNQE